jgi:hypothetical protein
VVDVNTCSGSIHARHSRRMQVRERERGREEERENERERRPFPPERDRHLNRLPVPCGGSHKAEKMGSMYVRSARARESLSEITSLEATLPPSCSWRRRGSAVDSVRMSCTPASSKLVIPWFSTRTAGGTRQCLHKEHTSAVAEHAPGFAWHATPALIRSAAFSRYRSVYTRACKLSTNRLAPREASSTALTPSRAEPIKSNRSLPIVIST